MADEELPGPMCFDCVHYPEGPADLQESAPDRPAGRSLTAEFFCPWIRRAVRPTYAMRCPEYQEAPPER